MVNSEEDSGSIVDGFERRAVPGSSFAEDMSEQFKNVGLEEEIMSVCDSNGGLESKVVDGDGWSESENESEIVYPVRAGAEDCSFYMRTGSCKYGSTCKFNHPLPHKTLIAVRPKEEDAADKLRPTDCKYYFKTGGCKYGESCQFNHTAPNSSLPELSFLGLPIRPGEIECPYYMRTGSCKYAADCKFNHPDPTTIGGTDSPSFHANNGAPTGSFSPKSTFQAASTSWSSPRHSNGTTTTSFIPTAVAQSHGVPSQTPEWNGYQASVYSPSTTYHVNNSSAETSIFSQYQHQMPVEEFPERPDQPECSYYLKTGDCKFKFTCKFHHPKNRLLKQPPYAFNDKGLPLRPDESICTHYSRYNICKYGPTCRFDHSVQPMYSAGSSAATVEPLQAGADGNESDGWN